MQQGRQLQGSPLTACHSIAGGPAAWLRAWGRHGGVSGTTASCRWDGDPPWAQVWMAGTTGLVCRKVGCTPRAQGAGATPDWGPDDRPASGQGQFRCKQLSSHLPGRQLYTSQTPPSPLRPPGCNAQTPPGSRVACWGCARTRWGAGQGAGVQRVEVGQSPHLCLRSGHLLRKLTRLGTCLL